MSTALKNKPRALIVDPVASADYLMQQITNYSNDLNTSEYRI